MVDPVTLGVIAAAFVVKAAEKAGEKAIDAGAKALGKLGAWLRERFSDDKDGVEALKRVEEVPDSPSRVGTLADAINRRAANDESFKNELEALVDEVQAAGVNTGDVTQTVKNSTGTVQIANTSGSTISVGKAAGHSRTKPTAAPDDRD